MLKSERRPVILYLVTIFLTTSAALAPRYGWSALLGGLLAVLFFALPIPAPWFVWKYLQRKNIPYSPKILIAAFVLAFGLAAVFCGIKSQSLLAGLLLGVLFYGYPGILLFALGHKFIRKF